MNNCKPGSFSKVNVSLPAYKNIKPLNKSERIIKDQEPEFIKEISRLIETKFEGKYISIAKISEMMSDQYELPKNFFNKLCRKHDIKANKNYNISKNEYEIKTKTFVCEQCEEEKEINNFKKCKGNLLGHQHICKTCQKDNVRPDKKTGKELVFTELFILGEQLKVHNISNADQIRVKIEEIKSILRGNNE